jgi:hypothetical protein
LRLRKRPVYPNRGSKEKVASPPLRTVLCTSFQIPAARIAGPCAGMRVKTGETIRQKALTQGSRVHGSRVMSEHRSAQRHRVLKGGTISFNGAGISCTVRNVSDTGAALDVTSPVGIPARFALVIDGEPVGRPCRVVWRKEKRIGIAFD